MPKAGHRWADASRVRHRIFLLVLYVRIGARMPCSKQRPPSHEYMLRLIQHNCPDRARNVHDLMELKVKIGSVLVT